MPWKKTLTAAALTIMLPAAVYAAECPSDMKRDKSFSLSTDRVKAALASAANGSVNALSAVSAIGAPLFADAQACGLVLPGESMGAFFRRATLKKYGAETVSTEAFLAGVKTAFSLSTASSTIAPTQAAYVAPAQAAVTAPTPVTVRRPRGAAIIPDGLEYKGPELQPVIRATTPAPAVVAQAPTPVTVRRPRGAAIIPDGLEYKGPAPSTSSSDVAPLALAGVAAAGTNPQPPRGRAFVPPGVRETTLRSPIRSTIINGPGATTIRQVSTTGSPVPQPPRIIRADRAEMAALDKRLSDRIDALKSVRVVQPELTDEALRKTPVFAKLESDLTKIQTNLRQGVSLNPEQTAQLKKALEQFQTIFSSPEFAKALEGYVTTVELSSWRQTVVGDVQTIVDDFAVAQARVDSAQDERITANASAADKALARAEAVRAANEKATAEAKAAAEAAQGTADEALELAKTPAGNGLTMSSLTSSVFGVSWIPNWLALALLAASGAFALYRRHRKHKKADEDRDDKIAELDDDMTSVVAETASTRKIALRSLKGTVKARAKASAADEKSQTAEAAAINASNRVERLERKLDLVFEVSTKGVRLNDPLPTQLDLDNLADQEEIQIRMSHADAKDENRVVKVRRTGDMLRVFGTYGRISGVEVSDSKAVIAHLAKALRAHLRGDTTAFAGPRVVTKTKIAA